MLPTRTSSPFPSPLAFEQFTRIVNHGTSGYRRHDGRSGAPDGEFHRKMRPYEEEPPSLQGQLLRKGLSTRSAIQSRCMDCGRSPLVGEEVHVYDDGRMLCELCRPNRREAPIRVERVRGLEHGLAVRPRAGVAAA